jgi:uncharacterized protein DUF1329
MRQLLIGFLLVLVFSLTGAALALADSGEVPMEQQAPLPEGTVITTQNWQQYKDYMPLWMQIIFSGQYAYSLGPNQQVVVGPRTATPFPREYAKNTEKYSGQVGLKVLPDGGTVIQNYTAGLPFPHPTNPNVGDKLLWDLWYRYIPRVEMAESAHLMLVDKYHQIFRQVTMYDYMRLAHVNEPGLPIYTPEAKDVDLALYTEVISPEQSKYTAALVLYFTDPTRIQEIWSFVPSLRRPLRLSASARCAPILGTDLVTDDQKSGFNMKLSESTGTLVAHKMTLMMNNVQPAYPTPIDLTDSNTVHSWGIDRGVAWPPAPSKWDLGETWVVDGKRVPDKLVGYCYGNRTVYIHADDFRLAGEDLYDMSGKLWKLVTAFARLHPNGYGDMFETGSGNYTILVLDIQNVHQTVSEILNGANNVNTQVAPPYWSVERYASPTGLIEIMK